MVTLGLRSFHPPPEPPADDRRQGRLRRREHLWRAVPSLTGPGRWSCLSTSSEHLALPLTLPFLLLLPRPRPLPLPFLSPAGLVLPI